MENIMTQETYDKLLAEMEANPLYQKSKSVHKGFQYRMFYDQNQMLVDGQQIRREDANTIPEGAPGYDESTARIVIYSFKDGILHSENNSAAIEYPGHWEYWDRGLITKVISDYGDTEEYWEDGVPVKIETNLSKRRANGEKI